VQTRDGACDALALAQLFSIFVWLRDAPSVA
jgi:hypothetical protein